MNIKNILIIVLVIAAGLMLGVIISTSLPSKSTTINKSSTQINNSANKTSNSQSSNKIEMTIIASPNPLKSYNPSIDHKKNWDKIDKSRLTITYQNKSDADLTGLQSWLTTTSSDILFSGTETAQQDKYMTSTLGKKIYNIPSIKAGATNKASIILFSSKPNIYKIKVEIHTKNNEIITSSFVDLTVL